MYNCINKSFFFHLPRYVFFNFDNSINLFRIGDFSWLEGYNGEKITDIYQNL